MRSVFVLFVVACGAKAAPPPPAPSCPAGPHVMSDAEIGDFQTKWCACTDDGCRDKLLQGDALISFAQIGNVIEQCRPSGIAMRELEYMKQVACACHDKQCAGTLEYQFENWSKRNADTKGTATEAEKAGKLIGDISDCIMKAQQTP